jgi:molecular chaperone DnaK (HSP70)
MTANESGELQAEPILIPQFEESGRETDDHILPSCIAWIKEKLLVGRGAEDLKPALIEGKNIWSSFKMELGIDLGPQYYNTELASGKTSYIIERPQDAAKVFFTYLREKVEDYVRTKKLPENIFYSVSVPASFEANQRQDLIRALSNAGILVDESSLIDEPNAGFLSYLFEMEKESLKKRFLDSLAEKKSRIMVFDFGAGTCDISVVEVDVENELLLSKNLAISKFMALGGDDIDREIAKKILLPQLVKEEEPTDVFTTIELENVVLPRLKPEAERLKTFCCKMIDTQGLNPESLRENTTTIRGSRIPAITIKNQRWELTTPQITLSEFAEVMDPIINIEDRSQDQAQNAIPNIFEPIHNALEKSGLSKDDLDMVLFIGGSCSNPVVRKAIEDYFGRFVGFYTPRDLRSHVSRGAANHFPMKSMKK